MLLCHDTLRIYQSSLKGEVGEYFEWRSTAAKNREAFWHTNPSSGLKRNINKIGPFFLASRKAAVPRSSSAFSTILAGLMKVVTSPYKLYQATTPRHRKQILLIPTTRRIKYISCCEILVLISFLSGMDCIITPTLLTRWNWSKEIVDSGFYLQRPTISDDTVAGVANTSQWKYFQTIDYLFWLAILMDMHCLSPA